MSEQLDRLMNTIDRLTHENTKMRVALMEIADIERIQGDEPGMLLEDAVVTAATALGRI